MLPLAPIGLVREEAAAYARVGTTLFDQMVADGRMPPPRMVNGKTIWDQEEVYAAFKALPHRDTGVTTKTGSDWSKVS
jgi:hypothetical protein